jgi:hypothetical protein
MPPRINPDRLMDPRDYHHRYKLKRLASQRAITQQRRDLLNKLKDRPCADCGFRYPYYVMDFDHRADEIKRFTISENPNGKHADFLAEAAKCDVVCSNCHRERTHKRGYGPSQPAEDEPQSLRLL